MTLYLPWWINAFSVWSGKRISSGCATVDGRVQCDPAAMAKDAEAKMRALGFDVSIPLEAYTLARSIASEVGSGTAAEKVCLAELTINFANRSGITVNQVLLYRIKGSAGYGAYGPIHGAEGVSSAPYGRWASTSKDPCVDDILIALFVLSGRSKNYAQQADDQWGIEYIGSSLVQSAANKHLYWVGPIPGVDHFHLTLFKKEPDVSPTSAVGKQKINALHAALAAGRPDWSKLPIAAYEAATSPIGIVVALAVVAGGAGLWYARKNKKLFWKPTPALGSPSNVHLLQAETAIEEVERRAMPTSNCMIAIDDLVDLSYTMAVADSNLNSARDKTDTNKGTYENLKQRHEWNRQAVRNYYNRFTDRCMPRKKA